MREDVRDADAHPVCVRFPYKVPMGVTLICPKCQSATELRGTLDAYYLTWCPECVRLWRFEIWTLVHADESGRKMPWLTGR
jgi:hypothetical protein